MAIICLEGASGVGKSTVAARLVDLTGAAVVPEVNLLFHRGASEPRYWYFERQADRWLIANNKASPGKNVILDGDPFQPVWYNWAYGYDFAEPAEHIHAFYSRLLGDGRIDFPDRYFILSSSEAELRARRYLDRTRTRKNFERHLHFIRPQRAYFEFLSSLAAGWVKFVESVNVDATARSIVDSISTEWPYGRDKHKIFTSISHWLSHHKAADFI